MRQDELIEPRFARLEPGVGGYESYYVKACHPGEPLGIWLRYTVHKRPGREPKGSLWVTLFDRTAEGPVALKQTFPAPGTGDGDLIRVGDSRLGRDGLQGQAQAGERSAAWDLRFRGEDPLRHLPRPWMYSAPLPRTKLLSPWPGAVFDGSIEIDGRALELARWPGMVGHNWGAEHAERWIWLHGAAFTDQGPGTWIDVALGRVKVGPLTTPWVANGALSLDGVRHRLGGLGAVRATHVAERPDGCELTLPGEDLELQVTLGAPRSAFVGWIYADPDGSEHHTVNCSVADMELDLRRGQGPPLTLRCEAGAAYELGMRERDHGMEIQPFPDG